MSASVATRNPFALLGDDGSRPASPAPPPKQAAPTPAAPTRGTAKPARGASRGGKYYQRGGARPGAGNPNQNGIDEAPGEGIRKETPRGRGGKRGGGRGGQSGGRGGRPFDKHSQTGRVDSEKKIHQSWGGDDGNAERQTEEAATRDAAADASGDWGADASGGADAWAGTAETPAVDDAAKAADDAAKEERRQRREREQEEEDSTLTLDQYLAQQKEKDTAVVPKLEVRQVDSEWKDVVPLQKSEDSSYYAGKEKSAPKARAKKEEKVYLDIDARFDRPQRGGPRGRGGPREGGERRGRGGRGGGRGGRPNTNQSQVNVDDETAFPSLS